MNGYTLVSESKTTTATVSHYGMDIKLSIREALEIQRKTLEMQFSKHPAYSRIKAETEATTFIDGLDLDKPMDVHEINRIVPRGGMIEAIAKKYTPIDYWKPELTPLGNVANIFVANTLNRDLPEFGGQLYVCSGDGSKPRIDVGYSRNDLPVEQQQAAMDAVFAYFKGLGYKTVWERVSRRNGKVKQVWVYPN